MDSSLHFNRAKGKKRHMTPPNCKTPILTLFTLLFCIVFFISSKSLFSLSNSIFQISTDSKLDQCTAPTGSGDSAEKFLWYAPHSGFSNQLSEFKNAILMAAILNRTLIVPPVLDHHAVALGSCPKFRVLNANELRFKVWNHSIQLLSDRRYTSMADIIDLSSLMSSAAVRFIDFRDFVSMWCGLNITMICTEVLSSEDSSQYERLKQCGSLLSGLNGNVKNCLYASREDCRMTVWTYQNNGDDGVLDSFQPDDELKKKKKITFVRKRRDVQKMFGPFSEAGSANVLAFGSLFTAPYKGSESHIDIHEAPRDQRIQSLIQKIEFLPLVSEIIKSGRKFAHETIKAPFLCAQLRLLDGQFKNHWKATFRALKEKMEILKEKGPLPVNVFVMTDLPVSNWTGSYLGDLVKDLDAFKLFVLREDDELVRETSEKLVKAKFRSVQCRPEALPNILLFIEETVCSCARLGFVGTAGSTIAQSIELMRKNSTCL